MAIEKTINIKVNTGNAESELNKLDTSFKKVDAAAVKTGKSVDDVASNGGAIAVLDQLTGGLATRFKDAYEASKLFNLSLKGMRTALIATGIGAFVVAIGLVVAYWDEINDAISGTSKKIQDQIDRSRVYADSLSTQLGLIESQIKLAGQQKINDKELLAKKIELLNKLVETNQEEIAGLNIQAAKIKAAAFELSIREKIVRAVLNAASAGSGDAFILEGQLEDSKKFLELQDLITKAKKEQVDTSIKIFDLENPEAKAGGSRDKVTGVGGQSVEQITDAENKLQDARIQVVNDRFNELFDLKKWQEEQLTGVINGEQLKRTANEAAAAEARKIIARQEAQEREQLEQAVSDAKLNITENTLALVGAIAKKGSAVGKAVAVAQATISGIEGVQNAFTTASASPVTTVFPAYPFVQAGLAGAFSAVQIAKILSVKSDSGGGGNAASGGGGGRNAPAFNLVQGTGSNQIAESLQSQKEPLKAYVVSSDMSSAQAVDRNIKENATI
jgi:hypothetical protein